MYERPYTDTPPPNGMGEMSIWWVNPDKAQALRASGAIR
jgi:microcin C transport system substrate-binding protein